MATEPYGGPVEDFPVVSDPLLSLRADEAELRAMSPLTRARIRMEQGERLEAAKQARAEQARRDAHEQAVQMQAMRDRVELAQQGYLTREAAAIRAEAENRRRGRAAELRAELDLLERGPVRLPGAEDVEAERVMAQARRASLEWDTDPAVQRMRAASHAAEIRRLEAELPRRVVSRSSAPGRVRRDRPPGPIRVHPRVVALERVPYGGSRAGGWSW
jgi:hypothetical protein